MCSVQLEKGRFKFSLKSVNQETGEDLGGDYQQNQQPVEERKRRFEKNDRRDKGNFRSHRGGERSFNKDRRYHKRGDRDDKKKGGLFSFLKRK